MFVESIFSQVMARRGKPALRAVIYRLNLQFPETVSFGWQRWMPLDVSCRERQNRLRRLIPENIDQSL